MARLRSQNSWASLRKHWPVLRMEISSADGSSASKTRRTALEHSVRDHICEIRVMSAHPHSPTTPFVVSTIHRCTPLTRMPLVH